MAKHGKDNDGDMKQSPREGDGQWPKNRPIPTLDPTKKTDESGQGDGET